MRTQKRPAQRPRFYCQECGHAFPTVKAAENAYAGDGCPKCGGADIDEGKPRKDNGGAELEMEQ